MPHRRCGHAASMRSCRIVDAVMPHRFSVILKIFAANEFSNMVSLHWPALTLLPWQQMPGCFNGSQLASLC
jgi:hypothetical protein